MSFVSCTMCGQQMSSTAVACPRCGHPSSRQLGIGVSATSSKNQGSFFLALLIVGLPLLGVIVYSQRERAGMFLPLGLTSHNSTSLVDPNCTPAGVSNHPVLSVPHEWRGNGSYSSPPFMLPPGFYNVRYRVSSAGGEYSNARLMNCVSAHCISVFERGSRTSDGVGFAATTPRSYYLSVSGDSSVTWEISIFR